MKCILKNLIRCESTQVLHDVSVLTDAVNKLYEAMGDVDKTIDYNPARDPITTALQDSSRAIRLIAKNIDRTRLESIANTEGISELEAELKNANKQIEALTIQNKKLQEDLSAQKRVAQSIGDDKKKHEPEILSLKSALTSTEQESGILKHKRMELAESLIKFRDQLMIFKDNFEEAKDNNAIKLLVNLYNEAGRFMSDNGIEIMNGGGVFSTEHHIVSSTIETDHEELDNTIVSTFRDGYRIDGKLYRPQEIVLYTYKNKESESHVSHK